MPGEFRRVPDSVVAQRHRAQRTSAVPSTGSRPEIAAVPAVRNIEPILTLGETRYFMFRRRAFGVPPLPYKKGQQMLVMHMRALALASILRSKGTEAKQ